MFCCKHAQSMRWLIEWMGELHPTRDGCQYVIAVSSHPHCGDRPRALQEHLAPAAAGGVGEHSKPGSAPFACFTQQRQLEKHRRSGSGKIDCKHRICDFRAWRKAPLERGAQVAKMLTQPMCAAGVLQIDLPTML